MSHTCGSTTIQISKTRKFRSPSYTFLKPAFLWGTEKYFVGRTHAVHRKVASFILIPTRYGANGVSPDFYTSEGPFLEAYLL